MRMSESLAKMRLAPFAGDTEVDEALRLFQVRNFVFVHLSVYIPIEVVMADGHWSYTRSFG